MNYIKDSLETRQDPSKRFAPITKSDSTVLNFKGLMLLGGASGGTGTIVLEDWYGNTTSFNKTVSAGQEVQWNICPKHYKSTGSTFTGVVLGVGWL